MKSLDRHMNPRAIVVLAIFMIATAGLRGVVEVCCGSEDPAEPAAVQGHTVEHESKDPPGTGQIGSPDYCHRRVLAGGSAGLTAVIKVVVSSTNDRGFAARILHPNRIPLLAAVTHRSVFPTDSSPPSVEKYVLTSAFLI